MERAGEIEVARSEKTSTLSLVHEKHSIHSFPDLKKYALFWPFFNTLKIVLMKLMNLIP